MVKLSKSTFIRNIIIVASGTAGAQAITILLTPIITRIYGPEIIGIVGVFSAIVIALSPLFSLGFSYAIVLPKNDNEAINLFKLSLISLSFFISITTLTFLLFSEPLIKLLGIDEVSQYIVLLPIAIFLYSLWQSMEQLLIRRGLFKEKAKSAIYHSILFNLMKVIFGFIYPKALVLVLITVFNGGIHSGFLYLSSRKKLVKNHRKTRLTNKLLFFKYIDFARYKAPEMSINAASQGLPIILLASFYGPAAAGFFTLARTIMGLPATLIGKSVGDVFYPRIAQAFQNKEQIYPFVKKASIYLCGAGAIPFLIVGFFGPYLFGFIFGDEWEQAGQYASWLSLWLFFMFINTPSMKALTVLGQQGFLLFFTLLTISTRLAVLIISHKLFESDIISIAVFCVSGAILNIILMTLVLIRCKKFDKERNV